MRSFSFHHYLSAGLIAMALLVGAAPQAAETVPDPTYQAAGDIPNDLTWGG